MVDDTSRQEPPKAPLSLAHADKLYEQRRAGLVPPDPEADRAVLAAREEKAKAAAARP